MPEAVTGQHFVNFYSEASPEDRERPASNPAGGARLVRFRFEHPSRRRNGSDRSRRTERLPETIRQEDQRK